MLQNVKLERLFRKHYAREGKLKAELFGKPVKILYIHSAL